MRADLKNLAMSSGLAPGVLSGFLDFSSSSLTAQTGRRVRWLQRTKSTVLSLMKL